ncbi:hypothetical protein PBY51_024037 [Eleginops maclovinus]|uniref:Uncharacterized protein n=1 Tax=Eleginops maclovinus TaxID=56733 RepID=A0AAN8AUJ5_ELEMC|nr:hypothetical protein PBY51_024037 [Eleginops maclovinus]
MGSDGNEQRTTCGVCKRDQGNNNAPYRDSEIPPQIIEQEQTSHCFQGVWESALLSPAAYLHSLSDTEVILIVFPGETIRSRHMLASQCTATGLRLANKFSVQLIHRLPPM